MEASVLAMADEVANAAELVMGKTDGIPLAIVRGYSYSPAPGSARELTHAARSGHVSVGRQRS